MWKICKWKMEIQYFLTAVYKKNVLSFSQGCTEADGYRMHFGKWLPSSASHRDCLPLGNQSLLKCAWQIEFGLKAGYKWKPENIQYLKSCPLETCLTYLYANGNTFSFTLHLIWIFNCFSADTWAHNECKDSSSESQWAFGKLNSKWPAFV